VDLSTVEAVSLPTSRDELWPLDAEDAVLAGGTWLFSEPQPHLRRLVDVTGLGRQPIVLSDIGIQLAATCATDTFRSYPHASVRPLTIRPCEG
jgi:hypothetical protein